MTHPTARHLIVTLAGGAALGSIYRLGAFFLAVPPSPWPLLTFGLIWSGVWAVAARDVSARTRALGMAALLLILAALGSFPLHSRERFLLDLRAIEHGMTRSEVSSAMSGYYYGLLVHPDYRQTAAPDTPLSANGCEVFRHSNSGSYDWDLGLVCFEEARVSEVRFLRD